MAPCQPSDRNPSIGQTVKVQIIRINQKRTISLGMKQLEADPWQDIGTSS